jgi:hypothetical protein
MLKIDVKCRCKGTGFIAVVDAAGEGVARIECAQDHPAYKLTIMDDVFVTCDHNNCGDHGFYGKVVGFDQGVVKVGYHNGMGEYQAQNFDKSRVSLSDQN